MMIVECPVKHQIQFQFFERTPKRARISKSAKCRNLFETRFRYRHAKGGVHIHPLAWHRPAAENGRCAVESSQLALQARVVLAGLGASHHKDSGTTEAPGRFPAAAQ